jgi:hypothetical protein
MKRVLLAATALLAIWATTLIPAKATTIDDPLHGTICDGSGGSCNANEVGGVVPGSTIGQPNVTFGFNSSPGGATGELWISVLVPTNELSGFTVPTLNSLGVDPGTNLAFGSPLLFNSGVPSLAKLIFGNSITSNPADPFSAFQSPESGFDPGLSAFNVYSIDVGKITAPGLNGQSDATAPDFFTLSNVLPPGSAITAFLVNGTAPGFDITATANSGQISIQQFSSVPGPVVGAGIPGIVTALLGMIGLNRFRRKRNGLIA